MSKNNQIKDRVELLRESVARHNYLYHTEDNPEISDEAYDVLLLELETLEKENKSSVINAIGGQILEKFKKVKHSIAQWSYEKAFTIDDIKNWEERNIKILNKSDINETINSSDKYKKYESKDIEYICELKIDGLKLVLTYVDGILTQAATRGDGEVGEDVISNALVIKDIPKVLNTVDYKNIIVVGEVWMEQSELLKINNKIIQETEEKNKEIQNKDFNNSKDDRNLSNKKEIKEPKIYANSRNLAAGTLRQLNSNVVAERNLKFFAYDINGVEINSQSQSLEKLIELGFNVNQEYKVVKNIGGIENFYQSWTERRNIMPYGIDGIVIKINNKSVFDALGYTAKAPRGGIAYKFKAQVAKSKVENIILQVGRTGAITPVAILTPVSLDGSVVSRATLHNRDEINRLSIAIGDTVELRKAGDIIPEIFNVIKELRPVNARVYKMAKYCPSCNYTLESEVNNGKESVDLYCKNTECPAKHIETLVHFVSKKCINIEMMGEKIVEELVMLGYISDFASVYELYKYKEELLKIDGYGEKSVDNLLLSIEHSKHVYAHKFLFALGIRHIGETTSKDLCKYIESNFKINSLNDFIDKLEEMTVDDYRNVEGIGEIVAQSLYSYFYNQTKENNKLENKVYDSNLEKVKNLIKYLILIKIENNSEKVKLFSKNINNKIFVITGTLPSMTRDGAKEYIESRGGKVVTSVSGNTDYVLAGIEAGSKLEKAKQLKVEVISEEQLYVL